MPEPYRTILADPPWPLRLGGRRRRSKGDVGPRSLPYSTMTVRQICDMGVGAVAAKGCHLWLWTTNQFLRDGFEVMEAWGFKYLAPIHWLKPSGVGCWFIHRSQTVLFGYRERCEFPLARYRPNVFSTGDPKRHSEKPDISYEYIESISPGPRLELFSRRPRDGWDAWGNEAVGGVDLNLC